MLETKESVERNYKDTLFRMIFNNKVQLLSLYNAVNGTNYENPEDVKINTLENAIYLNVKNDVSCVIGIYLNLYEHQSTFTPNMPLRDLIYITKLYSREIDSKSLYTSKQVKIPRPKFVVFYNGTQQQPERMEQRLSDSFEGGADIADSEIINLELTVTMLNVNVGRNKELLERCPTLKEYAIYVEKVRKYADYMDIEEAVDRAVIESIKEGVLQEFLMKYRAEAIQMSIFEYDEEKEMRLFREAEQEIGREVGMAKGREEGQASVIIILMRKKYQDGKSAKEIAEFLELDQAFVDSMIEMIQKGMTEKEIFTEIHGKEMLLYHEE